MIYLGDLPHNIGTLTYKLIKQINIDFNHSVDLISNVTVVKHLNNGTKPKELYPRRKMNFGIITFSGT